MFCQHGLQKKGGDSHRIKLTTVVLTAKMTNIVLVRQSAVDVLLHKLGMDVLLFNTKSATSVMLMLIKEMSKARTCIRINLMIEN